MFTVNLIYCLLASELEISEPKVIYPPPHMKEGGEGVVVEGTLPSPIFANLSAKKRKGCVGVDMTKFLLGVYTNLYMYIIRHKVGVI